MKIDNNTSNSVDLLWNDFLAENPDIEIKQKPVTLYFCDNEKDANECAELVVKGIKKATATSLWWLEKNNEALPKAGDLYVVTDWDGNAKAILETTEVSLTSYKEVSAEFAKIEGEGDKSLEYWKKVHEAYFTREMEPYGEKFSEDMIIICEKFRMIYTR